MSESDGVELPQPHEGIVGLELDDELQSLLSLDVRNDSMRFRLANQIHMTWFLALGSRDYTFYERMRDPQVGDLVVESSTRLMLHRWMPSGFGILLAKRREWACTDEEWEVRRNDPEMGGDGGKAREIDEQLVRPDQLYVCPLDSLSPDDELAYPFHGSTGASSATTVTGASRDV